MGLPAVTIVTPIFNEEAVLPELCQRLTRLLESHPEIDWHVILVNDGSRDRSAEIVRSHASVDTRFQLLELSRNFGFQSALSAGLAYAQKADAVVTMDADLQDPPEVIPALVDAWENGADVVRAVRRSRAERGPRRLALDAFHAIYGRLIDFPVEPNTGTFGLLSHAAVSAFNDLPERNRFFPGLRSWLGFTTADVPYDRQERGAGQPQQTFRRLVRYALDGIFSFSHLPLRLLTYTGLVIATVGFAGGIFFAARRLIGIEIAPTGFTTLAILSLFIGGVQLIGIGVLGEYLGRIYDEVKRRPNYIVKSPDKSRAAAASPRD